MMKKMIPGLICLIGGITLILYGVCRPEFWRADKLGRVVFVVIPLLFGLFVFLFNVFFYYSYRYYCPEKLDREKSVFLWKGFWAGMCCVSFVEFVTYFYFYDGGRRTSLAVAVGSILLCLGVKKANATDPIKDGLALLLKDFAMVGVLFSVLGGVELILLSDTPYRPVFLFAIESIVKFFVWGFAGLYLMDGFKDTKRRKLWGELLEKTEDEVSKSGKNVLKGFWAIFIILNLFGFATLYFINPPLRAKFRQSLLDSRGFVLQLHNIGNERLSCLMIAENETRNQKTDYAFAMEPGSTKEIGLLEADWTFRPGEKIRIKTNGYGTKRITVGCPRKTMTF